MTKGLSPFRILAYQNSCPFCPEQEQFFDLSLQFMRKQVYMSCLVAEVEYVTKVLSGRGKSGPHIDIHRN
jgi:hypothetical protein